MRQSFCHISMLHLTQCRGTDIILTTHITLTTHTITTTITTTEWSRRHNAWSGHPEVDPVAAEYQEGISASDVRVKGRVMQVIGGFLRFASLVALVLGASCSGMGQEVDFEVHNLSNEDVFVAQALVRGIDISGGWTKLTPGAQRSFKAEWACGLCLRVERRSRSRFFKVWTSSTALRQPGSDLP